MMNECALQSQIPTGPLLQSYYQVIYGEEEIEW